MNTISHLKSYPLSACSILLGPVIGFPLTIYHSGATGFDFLVMLHHRKNFPKYNEFKKKVIHHLKWTEISLLRSIPIIGGIAAIKIQKKMRKKEDYLIISTNELSHPSGPIEEKSKKNFDNYLSFHSSSTDSLSCDIDYEKLQKKSKLNRESLDSIIQTVRFRYNPLFPPLKGSENYKISANLELIYLNDKEFVIRREKIGQGSYKKIYYAVKCNFVNSQIKKRALVKTTDFRVIKETRIMHKFSHLENIVKPPEYIGISSDAVHLLLSLYDGDGTNVEGDHNKVRVALGLAKGVAVLHQANYVHGDIKLGNIFIKYHNKEKQRVSIVDLGDLGFTKKEHKTTRVTGSFPCLAPEFSQLSKEKRGCNKQTDLWALGITICELFYDIPNFMYEISEKLLQIESFETQIKEAKSYLEKLTQSVVDQDLQEFPSLTLGKKNEKKIHKVIRNLLQINPESRIEINKVVATLNKIEKNISRLN